MEEKSNLIARLIRDMENGKMSLPWNVSCSKSRTGGGEWTINVDTEAGMSKGWATGGYNIGVDPADDEEDSSSVTVWTKKNKTLPEPEPKEEEKSGRKKYFGKELYEMSDDELDSTLKMDSIEPEDWQEVLDEVKLRAMRKGAEVAVGLMRKAAEKEKAEDPEAVRKAEVDAELAETEKRLIGRLEDMFS